MSGRRTRAPIKSSKLMARRALLALSCAALLFADSTAYAQGFPRSDGPGGRTWQAPSWERNPEWRDPESRSNPPRGGDIREGGRRPEIAARAPTVVPFPHDYPAHSIVIDTGGRKLYYVLPDQQAYAYPISVGREGFSWTGTETISRKQAWPDWVPPAEMRERDPSLPQRMTGGLENPLGAMALYLGETLYRIHGTNDSKSLGRAQSSGCFRMLNANVLHLASITEIGTKVTVVSSLPAPVAVARAQIRPSPVPDASPPFAIDPPLSHPPPDYRALREHFTWDRRFGVPPDAAYILPRPRIRDRYDELPPRADRVARERGGDAVYAERRDAYAYSAWRPHYYFPRRQFWHRHRHWY